MTEGGLTIVGVRTREAVPETVITVAFDAAAKAKCPPGSAKTGRDRRVFPRPKPALDGVILSCGRQPSCVLFPAGGDSCSPEKSAEFFEGRFDGRRGYRRRPAGISKYKALLPAQAEALT